MQNLFNILIIWLLCIGVVASASGQANQFQEAFAAFKAKNYDKSIELLENMVEAKGEKAPTRLKMLLATSYFYLRDLKKSTAIFMQLSDKTPSVDHAFAWGIVFYKKKNYKVAIKGFRKVAKDSLIEFSYASYYLGLINLKWDNIPAAKYYLNRSDPAYLSSSFRSSRRDMLKVVSERISSPFEGLDKSVKSSSLANSLVNKSLKDNKQYDFDKSAQSSNEFVTTIKPLLEFSQLTSDTSNHRYTKSKFTLNQNTSQISIDVQKPESKRMNYGIKGTMGFRHYSLKENVDELYNISGSAGNFLKQTESSEESNELITSAEVYGEYEINSTMTANGKGLFYQSMPDFILKEALDILGVQGGLSLKLRTFEVDSQSSVKYFMNNNEEIDSIEFKNMFNGTMTSRYFLIHSYLRYFYTNKPYVTSTPYRFYNLEPYVSRPDGRWQSIHVGIKSDIPLFGGGLYLGLDVLQKSFTGEGPSMRKFHNDPIENAASGMIRLNAGYRYPLLSGLSAEIDTRYSLLSDYTAGVQEVDKTEGKGSPRLSADIDRTSAAIGFIVNPFDWLFLTAHYEAGVNNYAGISDASRVEELEINNPDSSAVLKLFLVLENSF